ncbi:MAG: MaoC family dehydratase N-terminal domain-containing protein [Novosphingobium sp.]
MSEDYTSWVGRSEERTDVLDPARSNALLSALGEGSAGGAGEPLPLLHHWLYFWDVRPPAGLGTDGHPARGGFLPPVALPRRMWAGGRLSFHAPLLLGEAVTRVSTILKVNTKSGKSGSLVFVTVEHRLTGGDGLAIVEEQDIVYREAAAAGSIAMPSGDAEPPQAAWSAKISPDPVLLFRYSALTMNGHRIHYDLPYAMEEEAYPALVVQGPLQATILAAHASRHLGKPLTRFDFRGQTPAFSGVALQVCGDPAEGGASLYTAQGGGTCMVANAGC